MTQTPLAPALELLLAHADDGLPALADGLPGEATWNVPPPDPGPPLDQTRRSAPAGDPNDLRLQRWGVIAPEGSLGDKLLQAIDPLLRLRETEQGASPRIYRVPADMDANAALCFREDVYRAEDVPDHERPRYLLILGDLDQVSIDLQQVLANSAFVGRIHFSDSAREPSLAGYTAYARKVIAWAGKSADALPDPPAALFYAVRDGTRATGAADALLVQPAVRTAESWRKGGNFPASSVVVVPDDGERPKALLEAVQAPNPQVLLSVSHGLGAPRAWWASVAQQRATQGALDLGPGKALSAELVRSGPFLPGGLWLCFACFSAGTPAASAFHPWLTLLAQEGAYPTAGVDLVLKSLPREGDRPFVAAMPQAALANPEGPLAFIGHVDLAWTYGFVNSRNQSRASRFLSVLTAMVSGSRAGVALDALMLFYRETNEALMVGYQSDEDARARRRPSRTRPADRGNLWMLRQDLRGYILLGDPAARISIRPQPSAATTR